MVYRGVAAKLGEQEGEKITWVRIKRCFERNLIQAVGLIRFIAPNFGLLESTICAVEGDRKRRDEHKRKN